MEENNPEKMERPRSWPDPPELKLPEMTIGCPACNDRENRMTLHVDLASGEDYSVKGYFIECNKCGTKFKLVRTEIIQKSVS